MMDAGETAELYKRAYFLTASEGWMNQSERMRVFEKFGGKLFLVRDLERLRESRVAKDA